MISFITIIFAMIFTSNVMFMEKFSSGSLMLEYVDITKTKEIEKKEDF